MEKANSRCTQEDLKSSGRSRLSEHEQMLYNIAVGSNEASGPKSEESSKRKLPLSKFDQSLLARGLALADEIIAEAKVSGKSEKQPDLPSGSIVGDPIHKESTEEKTPPGPSLNRRLTPAPVLPLGLQNTPKVQAQNESTCQENLEILKSESDRPTEPQSLNSPKLHPHRRNSSANLRNPSFDPNYSSPNQKNSFLGSQISQSDCQNSPSIPVQEKPELIRIAEDDWIETPNHYGSLDIEGRIWADNQIVFYLKSLPEYRMLNEAQLRNFNVRAKKIGAPPYPLSKWEIEYYGIKDNTTEGRDVAKVSPDVTEGNEQTVDVSSSTEIHGTTEHVAKLGLADDEESVAPMSDDTETDEEPLEAESLSVVEEPLKTDSLSDVAVKGEVLEPELTGGAEEQSISQIQVQESHEKYSMSDLLADLRVAKDWKGSDFADSMKRIQSWDRIRLFADSRISAEQKDMERKYLELRNEYDQVILEKHALQEKVMKPIERST